MVAQKYRHPAFLRHTLSFALATINTATTANKQPSALGSKGSAQGTPVALFSINSNHAQRLPHLNRR